MKLQEMAPNSPFQLHFQLSLTMVTGFRAIYRDPSSPPWPVGCQYSWLPGWSLSCHMTCFGQWEVSAKEMCHFSEAVLTYLHSLFPREVHFQMELPWAITPEWQPRTVPPLCQSQWMCRLMEKLTCVVLIHWDLGIFLMQPSLVSPSRPLHRGTWAPYRR